MVAAETKYRLEDVLADKPTFEEGNKIIVKKNNKKYEVKMSANGYFNYYEVE